MLFSILYCNVVLCTMIYDLLGALLLFPCTSNPFRYDELCSPGYPFGTVNPRNVRGTGHFTQVVWKDSVELGIGVATSHWKGMTCTYLVGRYKPPGNFNTGSDDYNKNVKEGRMFDKAAYCGGQVSQSDATGTKLREEATQGSGYELDEQEVNLQPVWKQSLQDALIKKRKIHSKWGHGEN